MQHYVIVMKREALCNPILCITTSLFFLYHILSFKYYYAISNANTFVAISRHMWRAISKKALAAKAIQKIRD